MPGPPDRLSWSLPPTRLSFPSPPTMVSRAPPPISTSSWSSPISSTRLVKFEASKITPLERYTNRCAGGNREGEPPAEPAPARLEEARQEPRPPVGRSHSDL